jgi:CRP/FNR family transcriptional regulator, cyclic AMP receptor protein
MRVRDVPRTLSGEATPIARKERRASDAALPFSSCRWIVDPKVRMLGAVPLFQGLSARELMDIVEVARDVEFPAGTTIVSQGSQATDFFLILDGEARVTVGRRDRRTLRPGDYFGETAVLDGGRRSAAVIAETAVWALRLERSNLIRLLDHHGSIGRKMLIDLSRRFREVEAAEADS